MSLQAPSNSPTSSEPWLEAVQSLDSSGLEALRRLLRPKWNSYLERAAQVESAKAGRADSFPSITQTAFLLLDKCEDVLFGGATRGGKSSAVLAAALQYVDEPAYKALVFRQKFTDLEQPDGLIPRSHEWLGGTKAHWSGDTRQWTFPNQSVLKFGYLASQADRYNYQGAAAHYWGFDEAGLIDPAHMMYLKTRASRPSVSSIPIRFRYSANPGGPSHEWLYENFIILGGIKGYVFVPSKAVDNPGIDLADYLRRMELISDPVLKAQLLHGDWTAIDRNQALVPEWTEEIAAACTREVPRPEHLTTYTVGDLGSRDLTVWLFLYWDFEAALYVVEDELVMRDPSTAEMIAGVKRIEAELWPNAREQARRFSDVDWRLVKDFREAGLKLVPTKKDDALGARNRARAMLGKQRVAISPRCQVLLRTLKSAVWNEQRTDFQRTEETGHADAWATLIYAIRNVATGHNPAPPEETKVIGANIRPPSRQKPVAAAAKKFAAAFPRKRI